MLWLSEAGWRCHLPQFVHRQRRYGRTEAVLRPIFPTYLFVSFDPHNDPWGSILRLDHIVRRIFTSAPGCPLRLRAGEVERLMAMGRAGDGVIDEESAPFGEGDVIQVLDGAFRDWTGICKWSVEDRVGVMLTLFAGDRVVKMPRESVRLVSHASRV
jgi:transcription antitermination factor NusG